MKYLKESDKKMKNINRKVILTMIICFLFGSILYAESIYPESIGQILDRVMIISSSIGKSKLIKRGLVLGRVDRKLIFQLNECGENVDPLTLADLNKGIKDD